MLARAHGFSTLFLVFIILTIALVGLTFLTFSIRFKILEQDNPTQIRMRTIRQALKRYYLSHHNLPNQEENPQKSVPVRDLMLAQKYRFDSNGQFLHYERRPEEGSVDINGLQVRGRQVAAVLVAPGPDKVIAQTNLKNPYAQANATNDDIVLGISLNSEAQQIARKVVNLLQRAAIAYDKQFQGKNNDGNQPDEYPQPITLGPGSDGVNGTIDDETITPRPIIIIDEGDNTFDVYNSTNTLSLYSENKTFVVYEWKNANGAVSARGGKGNGCVRYGLIENDPSRGTYSLDYCPTNKAAIDIVSVFGLGQKYAIDPWGNAYIWGGSKKYSYGNPRYWKFFSKGPDETIDTVDDIISAKSIPIDSNPTRILVPNTEGNQEFINLMDNLKK